MVKQQNVQVVAVIPARLASTRIPRKVLVDINGKPLLWYVWHQVRKAKGIRKIFIATDSDEVTTVVRDWGGNVLTTSSSCRSGTERIASAISQIGGDFILNIQGDEPLIDPELLESTVRAWKRVGGDVITPVYRLKETAQLLDPNIVKVVRSSKGRALYFSRSPIPHLRGEPVESWLEHQAYWGHVGVYGYRRDVLEGYFSLPPSDLESAERLEQLRFLEAGCEVMTFETKHHSIAINTPEDLDRVRAIIKDKNED
jgi:3-deoxy-manno-octulosonate cytidylyltransferase (CMP-KDO synthetase)